MNELELFEASRSHHLPIIQLWEDSVLSTHHFLQDDDVQFYKAELTKALNQTQVFCLQKKDGELLGFMGVNQIHLEMLFIHPRHMRKGIGRALLQTAREQFGISRVSVNEQNHAALSFYKACGFEIISRSELDDFGKPYPIVQLEIDSSQASVFVDWNNFASSWETTPGVKDFAQYCFRDLSKRQKLQGLRVLDFGCGTGLLTELLSLSGAEVVAVDSSEKMLEILAQKKLSHVQILQSDLNFDDIKTEKLLQTPFDIIVASSVMAFVSNQSEKFSQLHGLLHDNGHFFQWDWLKVTDGADFGFHPKDLQKLYESNQFKIISLGESFEVKSENGVFKALLVHACKA